MGWRNRFDPRRISADQIRERARRIGDIRALGQQVAAVRRKGLRGEFVVPVVALLILAAALGLSALSQTTPGQTGPTAVAINETTTPGAITSPPAEALSSPAGSGYPAGRYPAAGELATVPAEPPANGEATEALTSTTTLSGTAVAEGTTGYPGMQGPVGVDPALGGVPQAPQPENNSAGAYPPINSEPLAPPPAPQLIPPTPVPAVVPPVRQQPQSGYPPPVNVQPTISAPVQQPPDVEAPTQAAPGSEGQPPPEAGTPSVAPTAGSTPTPEPTPVPPTPTPRPAEVISGELHWTSAQSPVVINKDQLLAAGSSLTIDPGVEVRLAPGVQFTIGGTLRAQGTEAAPVRFVGADGRWDALIGTSGSTIILDHAQIRQAGGAGTALSSTGGSLVVHNSSLTESGGGIVALGSSLDLRGTQISGNNIGGPVVNVQMPQQRETTIVGNVIGGNGTPAGAPQVLLAANDAAGPLAIEGNLFTGGKGGPGVVINTNVPLRGTIRCNGFKGGTVGLQLAAQRPDTTGFNLAIDQNGFAGQATYGATGTLGFNLANNWWGDPSGPSDAQRNPQGRGVPVGVNLQFRPWQTAYPDCAPGR